MRFYINHIDDTSIPNSAKVLPVLSMELINDGRHEYHRFHEMIQNATIKFFMVDIETGVYKIANAPAYVTNVCEDCCSPEFMICYQFSKRDVSTAGTFKGWFVIDFGDDMKNDEYTYPTGILKVPIRDTLEIVVR